MAWRRYVCWESKPAPPLTSRQRLHLSALEKWRLYNRFPWKLVLAALLTLAATTRLVLLSAQDADVFLSVRLALVGAVLEDADAVAWTVRLEDANNTAASVTSAIDGWRDLEDVAVDTFLLLHEGRLEVTLVDAPCSRSACLADPHCDWDECVRTAETSTAAVPPRADDAMGAAQSPQEWDRLLRMRLALPVRSLIVGTLFSQCADWIINVEWEVGGGACTATAVPSIASFCDAGGKDIVNVIGRRFGWLDLLVIALALAYSALLLLRAFRQLRTFWQTHSAFVDDGTDSDADVDDDNDDAALGRAAGAADPEQVAVLAVPGCLACVRAVSPVWTVSAASGALLTAAASVITLAQGGARHPGPTLHGLCLGIGSFLLWMSALRYLEFSRATYGIVLTLQRAAPRVLVFVAGALPLLFAYAAFGVAFFGDTVEGFSGPRQACVTLFSVLNGDVILDTFAALMGRFPFVGQVYVYSFVSLFIYVVLNVLIALVEEAFFQSSAETSAILERQRSKQGLLHRMPGAAGGSPEQAAAGGVDLDSVDLLAQNPRDDLDALQSQASGARDAWRTALRLKEWDEVASNAGPRFR